MKYLIVKTTFEKRSDAQDMAKMLLEKHLISCAQISEIDSMYHWKGAIACEHEFILTMKTRKKLYKALEKTIKEHHSYEIPQIIATPIVNGLNEYLNWIDETTEE